MEVHKNVSERFLIGPELGRGAYGRVFKATPRAGGQPVALKRGIKVLSDKTDAQRTLREARVRCCLCLTLRTTSTGPALTAPRFPPQVCILQELREDNHPFIVRLDEAPTIAKIRLNQKSS